jgi:hypothetical protein
MAVVSIVVENDKEVELEIENELELAGIFEAPLDEFKREVENRMVGQDYVIIRRGLMNFNNSANKPANLFWHDFYADDEFNLKFTLSTFNRFLKDLKGDKLVLWAYRDKNTKEDVELCRVFVDGKHVCWIYATYYAYLKDCSKILDIL